MDVVEGRESNVVAVDDTDGFIVNHVVDVTVGGISGSVFIEVEDNNIALCVLLDNVLIVVIDDGISGIVKDK